SEDLTREASHLIALLRVIAERREEGLKVEALMRNARIVHVHLPKGTRRNRIERARRIADRSLERLEDWLRSAFADDGDRVEKALRHAPFVETHAIRAPKGCDLENPWDGRQPFHLHEVLCRLDLLFGVACVELMKVPSFKEAALQRNRRHYQDWYCC